MKISTLLRLGAFLVVAGFLAAMELTTLTSPHTGDTDTFHAMFGGADGVSGLRVGNPVKVAGVPVGKVTGVDLVDARSARVTFTANHNQTVTDRTYAVVRYANLLGQRFLALTQDPGPAGTALAPGATIPDSRTMPALSLTDLFNGFRPLFAALTPQQVNELSQDIIDVLQGQAGRVEDLVARTASLTTNLAGRNDAFGRVLTSMSTLLGTVAKHDSQLGGVVTTLSALTTALHRDGPAIVGSLGAVDELIGSTAGLLGKLQDHSLPAVIADTAQISGVLANNTASVEQLVTGFVSAFETFSRVSQNGNWVSVYTCNVSLITYGTVSLTATQGVTAAVNGLLGTGNPLAGVVNGALSKLGLNKVALPVPLTLPNGRVGGSTAHTAVCR